MTSLPAHRLDVYGVVIHLAVSRKEWGALRASHDALAPLGRVKGTTAFWGDGEDAHVAFYVDGRLESGPLLEVVAHEATHGAAMIMDHFQAPYDGQNEPFAMLVGWLTRWLWENTP